MKRIVKIVDADLIKPRFEQSAIKAVTQAIANHHKNGRDTYGVRNGKIVAIKPDGRIVEIE